MFIEIFYADWNVIIAGDILRGRIYNIRLQSEIFIGVSLGWESVSDHFRHVYPAREKQLLFKFWPFR